jgi:uncharacterized protein YbjT (DUF2867 family)
MILITGATGNIGSEVIKLLTASGVSVRALVRDPQKAVALQEAGIELAFGSFEQPETLQAALEGIETAFLLSPSTPEQVHVQSNFVDAAKRSGVRHLVKLSGAGASENNPQQFARWHWQVEQYIRASGIPFTFVQPIYFMQNFLGKDTAQMIAQQGRFAAPIKADLRFNMVDARDIAAVVATTLSEKGHEGQTYVLTGPELLSSNEQAERFSRLLGKQVTFMEVPSATFRNILLGVGQPQWLTDSVLELFENLDTFVNNTVTDIAKKPAYTFDQFISDHIQSFRALPPQTH